MSNTKKATGPISAPQVPGPETFSFEDYIAGKSTFPQFSHTVYLDQARGVALLHLTEEYDALALRAREIQMRQVVINENPRGLVDDEFDALSDELEDIVAKTDELEKQILVVEEEVKSSSMTMTFQVSTAQKLGEVVRRAEKAYDKKYGRKGSDDLEYATAKGKYQMAAQLTEFCIRVNAADGRELSVPTIEGFETLLSRLITSETLRLMTALNSGLDSSAAWAERLDAGFPGGGADVAEQSVGAAGSSGGQELVGSAADVADGGEDNVEG